MPDLPSVTVLIPMRNEERHIAACLDSVLRCTYPKARLEILVLDGQSTDRSADIVRAYAQQHPNIRLLSNPGIIQATALNLGIREAKGEIIVRLDAHTHYARDYIAQCVEKLTITGADNVGGRQHAVGDTYVTYAIAVAMNSPFGFGNSPFHYATDPQWVDTVYLGCWRKATLEELGGFDEDAAVNEDYELNARLRAAGGRILLSPEIRSEYHVRPTLRALARQFFRYGSAKVRTLVLHPHALQPRQVVPPLFVVAFGLSLVLLPVVPLAGLLPLSYLIVTLVWSAKLALKAGIRYLPLLPVVFATMHLSWGIGFLVGLARWGVPRIDLRTLRRARRSDHRRETSAY